MKRSGWIVCLLGWCFSQSFAGPSDALALQQRLIDVFEENRDAVVRVKAAFRTADDEEGNAQVTLRVGTGFFISKEGHVLVSASRAVGADRVWVEYGNESFSTESVGHDRLTNVSVLRVLNPPEDFKIISIDASLDRPALGSIAFSIACPLDFEPSPSMGIITGIDKKLGSKIFPTEYIRTSISVDAGQGGCPVLDINGRLLGMSVASIPDIGGSYILPPEALSRVRDDLMFSGHIIYSWMGFEVGEMLNTDDTNAVYLSKIVEGAPAEKAGLRAGDHLISIDNRPIRTMSDVPGAIFFTRANQFCPVKIRRGEEVIEVSVKTVPRPEKDDLIGQTAASENLNDPDLSPQ